MIGETGTEQLTIITRQDGKVIREQQIHDPFIHSTTTIGISRWDLFKALFRKQFETKIQVEIRGTEGAVRAWFSLDAAQMQKDTEQIIESRRNCEPGTNYCSTQDTAGA